jgi:pimeloyl-ACP methyl ester carboxylesterase
MAASRPESVGALVLTGVPLLRLRPPTKPAAGYRVARWLQKRGLVSEDRLERERQKRGSADYRAAGGVMRDILVKVVNESYEAELATLRSPVRLLWGELDTEAPVSVARAALEILRGNGADASLVVLGGIGHMLPLEEPAALRSVVDSLSG